MGTLFKIVINPSPARLHRVVKKQFHKNFLILSKPENKLFHEPELQIFNPDGVCFIGFADEKGIPENVIVLSSATLYNPALAEVERSKHPGFFC
jgi:hypothetical protein